MKIWEAYCDRNHRDRYCDFIIALDFQFLAHKITTYTGKGQIIIGKI